MGICGSLLLGQLWLHLDSGEGRLSYLIPLYRIYAPVSQVAPWSSSWPCFIQSWSLDRKKKKKNAQACPASLWWCWVSHHEGPGKAVASGGVFGISLRSGVQRPGVTPSRLWKLGVRCLLLYEGILVNRLSAFDSGHFMIRWFDRNLGLDFCYLHFAVMC